MTLYLFKNKSDKKYLNKNLDFIGNLNIKVKDGLNVISPSLTILDFPNECNYIFIDELQRYYFVEKVNSNGRVSNIALTLDWRQTYANEFLSLRAIVLRQEFNYSPYVFDPLLPVRSDKTIYTNNIGVVGTGTNAYKYYLMTNGG